MSEIFHPIPPVFDGNSKILILGSFPSVASRDVCFFYGHTQNRFWRVISAILGVGAPTSTDEKKELLISHGIALWDVIASCEIVGSQDSTIKRARPNNLDEILSRADVRAIFVNGKTALKYYNKYMLPKYSREAVCLPSTSPANAMCSFDRLVSEWGVIKDYLK